MKTKFPLGKVYQTCHVNQVGEEHPAFRAFALQALRRHATGDWGDCAPDDQATNNEAINTDFRIFLLARRSLGEGGMRLPAAG